MKVAFLIRMKQDLKEWYEKEAEKIGISTTSIMIQALRMYKEYCEEQEKISKIHEK